MVGCQNCASLWLACLLSALLGPIEIGGFGLLPRAFMRIWHWGDGSTPLRAHISMPQKEADALTFETQVQGLGSRSRKASRRIMI